MAARLSWSCQREITGPVPFRRGSSGWIIFTGTARSGAGEELILEAEDDSGKRQLRLFLPGEPKEPEPQG